MTEKFENAFFGNKKYKPTDEQKNAVFTDGRVIVSAAAGSGKTSTLIRRIIYKITKGVPLSRMLILVYNNAAADELYEGLHEKLFEAACTAEGDIADLFRRELDRLPFASIGTIHSFCQTLIREHFEKLGVSPDFEVIDAETEKVYMSKALDAVFEKYAEENDDVFETLAAIFARSRKEDNLKSIIIRLYEAVEIQPDKEGFINGAREMFDGFENGGYASKAAEIIKNTARLYMNECETLLNLPLDGLGLVSYAESVEKARRCARAVVGADSFSDVIEIVKTGFEKGSPRRLAKQNEEAQINAAERAKNAVNGFSAYLKSVADLLGDTDAVKTAHVQNAAYAKKLFEAVGRFDETLSDLKKADNALSFSDLEQNAAKLIKSEALTDFGFDEVFVDEYQDVNPTQEFIISAIDKGKSFFVGDVKQSIYGFRLADPTIFLEREARYKNGGGSAIGFNRNFRSGKQILEFVNNIFDVVMTKEKADVDYKADARFITSEASDCQLVQIHFFCGDKPKKECEKGLYDITKDDGVESFDDSAAEGAFIADEIKKLVGSAKTEDGVLDYGDIAVLFRSRSSAAQTIVKTMAKKGIPLETGGFSVDKDAPESELLNFLRVLDNPSQDIPFAGFLLSFFGGYNEEELAKIAAYGDTSAGGAEPGFYEKFCAFAYRTSDNAKAEDKSLILRAARTLEELETYRLKASFKSVSELMCAIVSDFGFDAYVMRGGETAVYELKSFLLQPAAVDSSVSLSKFLSGYAEKNENKKSGGGNRVIVSTYHSFKGLEKQAVFLADIAHKYSRRSTDGDLISDSGGFVGIDFYNRVEKTKRHTLSRFVTENVIRFREKKEEMRLFYVALTRAKRYLYISGAITKSAKSTFGILPSVDGASSNLDLISDAAIAHEKNLGALIYTHDAGGFPFDTPNGDVPPLAAMTDPDIVKAVYEARKFDYPYAASTELALKYSVSQLDSADDLTVKAYDVAAEAGTAYHKVMQYIEYGEKTESEIKSLIKRMVDDGLISEVQAAAVKPSDIVKCLSSEIMLKAAKSTAFRELPFMMYVPADELKEEFRSSDKVLVQGVIDVYIDGDEKILVDFKNSALKDKRTLEKYKKQLYLYKTAVESHISAKIDKIALYSFKTGETIYL